MNGKKKAQKMFKTGTHASPVQHLVMGTWVHYHTNRQCIHDWVADEERKDRFTCPHCGGLRSWRRDHVRGDASKGTTLHTYEVVR